MNKNIITGVISVLCGILVAVPAYAYFNSVAVSATNIFSTGTLKLKLANSDSVFADNVTATFGGAGLAPGVCLPMSSLQFKNTGTVKANHADITATNTDADFASIMRLKTITFDNSPVSLPDSNSNGYPDLKDLATSGIINKPLTDFAVHTLTMEVCMDETAGNAQQGKSNSMDISVTLDQGAHI